MNYVMALGIDPTRRGGMQQADDGDHDRLWPVQDRLKLLSDLSIRRLCITVDAGVGKSIALQQLQYATQQRHPEHLVICLELRHVPARPRGMLDENRTIEREECPPLLVDLVQHAFLSAQGNAAITVGRMPEAGDLQGWLQSMANRGHLTLCVDGIDQSSINDAFQKASILRQFMECYPCIRLIVAGRPYSIGRVANKLGFNELVNSPSGGQQPVWQFGKVERFTRAQVEEYLGTTRYEQTQQFEADQQFLPRTLNIVRTLNETEMAQMQTASELCASRFAGHFFARVWALVLEGNTRSAGGRGERSRPTGIHGQDSEHSGAHSAVRSRLRNLDTSIGSAGPDQHGSGQTKHVLRQPIDHRVDPVR